MPPDGGGISSAGLAATRSRWTKRWWCPGSPSILQGPPIHGPCSARWLLKAKDPELFDREYRKQLDALDPKQVAKDLGPDAILLCWESFNVRCDRRLVAEWLEERLGIVVPELGHERSESVPFSEQPSKWDGKPTTSQLPMTF
jgi:hypothetical protein